MEPGADIGERSIVKAIQSDPALYDATTGQPRPGTFEIASNDTIFFDQGHPYTQNVVKAQAAVEQAAVDGRILVTDYKSLATEGSPSIGNWTDPKTVTADFLNQRGFGTTVDGSGNFVLDTDGNPATSSDKVTVSESAILRTRGSAATPAEYLGAAAEDVAKVNAAARNLVNTHAIGAAASISEKAALAAKAGLLLMALDVSVSIGKAISQANAGDTDGAAKTMGGLEGRVALGIAGAEAGAMLGLDVAAGLVAAGVLAVGSPLIGVAALVGGAALGIVGGVYGTQIGEALANVQKQAISALAHEASDIINAFPHSVSDIITAGETLFQAAWNAAVGRGSGDPIILDLDGNGVELTSRADSNVYFNIAGTDYQNMTAWAGGNDGMLVDDKDGSGAIDSVNELIGGNTPAGGFADLAANYDTNHDTASRFV